MFRVDPAKVPADGVRARCSVCGSIIPVHNTEIVGQVAAAVFAPAAFTSPSQMPDQSPAALTTGAPAESMSTVDTEASKSSAKSSAPFPPVPMAAPVLASAPTTVAPAITPGQHAGDPRPESEQELRQEPQPELLRRININPTSSVSAASVSSPPPVEARPPEPRVAPRRVNPYLSNDPAQKARRLARALVSDLVAYNPQKREEGLRGGTLKELFREEIRKSWHEYVEQVGAPIAESTPHFQDALNDILAGGRRIF